MRERERERERDASRRVISRRPPRHGEFQACGSNSAAPPSPPSRCNSRDINYWNRRRRSIQPSRSSCLAFLVAIASAAISNFSRAFPLPLPPCCFGLSSANRQPLSVTSSSASFSSSEEVPWVNFAEEQPRDYARLIFNRLRLLSLL